MIYFLFRINIGDSALASGHDVVRAEVERSKNFKGNFTVEAKALKADSLDFIAVLVQRTDL